MRNKRLEREKDSIDSIIYDLVSEIEELETINDDLSDRLDNSLDRIKELESEVKELNLILNLS